MLEILALVFFSKKIGEIALLKGEKPSKWKIILILSWIAAEIIGIGFSFSIFGPSKIYAMLIGIGFALTSYYFVLQTLSKKPDVDDIESIGNN
jgi:hypothetical protein